jgi:post-segregation antitoxin (ccd killing protein)
MTRIVFNLPDTLAKEAKAAGLLVPDAIERLLREELRKEAVDRLFENMERMQAIADPQPMTPEEVAGEIREMRSERRKAKAA